MNTPPPNPPRPHPQVLTETLNFLSASVQDFGLALFDVPALLDWAKQDLGSAVAGTRTAAIAMVGFWGGGSVGLMVVSSKRVCNFVQGRRSGCEMSGGGVCWLT